MKRIQESNSGALRIKKNMSTPEPDGLNYHFIKAVVGTTLREGLLNEVADSLFTGTIPAEWREMKVVMTPKAGKGHSRAKAWRPNNLIICVGKIGKRWLQGGYRKQDCYTPYSSAQ